MAGGGKGLPSREGKQLGGKKWELGGAGGGLVEGTSR